MKSYIATAVVVSLLTIIWSQNKTIHQREQLLRDMSTLTNIRQEDYNQDVSMFSHQIVRAIDAINQATAEILRLKYENYMYSQMLFNTRIATNGLLSDMKEIHNDLMTNPPPYDVLNNY